MFGHWTSQWLFCPLLEPVALWSLCGNLVTSLFLAANVFSHWCEPFHWFSHIRRFHSRGLFTWGVHVTPRWFSRGANTAESAAWDRGSEEGEGEVRGAATQRGQEKGCSREEGTKRGEGITFDPCWVRPLPGVECSCRTPSLFHSIDGRSKVFDSYDIYHLSSYTSNNLYCARLMLLNWQFEEMQSALSLCL